MKARSEGFHSIQSRLLLALSAIAIIQGVHAANLIRDGGFADPETPWAPWPPSTWNPLTETTAPAAPVFSDIAAPWSFSDNKIDFGTYDPSSPFDDNTGHWTRLPSLLLRRDSLPSNVPNRDADGDGWFFEATSRADNGIGGSGSLSQTMSPATGNATVAGEMYKVSFWLSAGPRDPHFQVFWDDFLIYDLLIVRDPEYEYDSMGNFVGIFYIDAEGNRVPVPQLPEPFGSQTDSFGDPYYPAFGFGWTYVELYAAANGETTELSFDFLHETTWWRLDDVRVESLSSTVPEGGATLGLIGLGLAGLVGFRRRN